jgi:hypothetical protein
MARSYICKERTASQMVVNQNISTMMSHKFRATFVEVQWCHWGFFQKLPMEPCVLGLIQPVKMSTRKTPGGEGGRCVRVTTLPPS